MALQNSLRLAMITKLFASAGVYPYDPLTIFRSCKTRVRSIMDKLPMLTKKLLSQGGSYLTRIWLMQEYVTTEEKL